MPVSKNVELGSEHKAHGFGEDSGLIWGQATKHILYKYKTKLVVCACGEGFFFFVNIFWLPLSPVCIVAIQTEQLCT